jgi:exopolyphosphatase/guanosine-5'-triphosphate,3'-diphosphate pyrophosphatase
MTGMTLSVIDIGTNTILMVTAAVEPDGSIVVLGDEHEIARLGKGVDAARMITPETFDRVAEYLNRYVEVATSLGSERIIAFGTSALRDARNNGEFIAAMYARTGLTIRILSGEDEARQTYLGAFFGMHLRAHRRGVLDIGGGSTEIAYGDSRRVEKSISLDIGAVRVTERFLKGLPAEKKRIDEAREFVRGELAACFDIPEKTLVVGVAGTVTTLGAISIGQSDFKAEELNRVRLGGESIAEMAERLPGLTLDQVIAIPGVHPGRADVLPAGAIILDEFMKRQRLKEIVVSTRGVRYGVLMEAIHDSRE